MDCEQLCSKNKHCTTCNNHSSLVSREKKSEYRIENRSKGKICRIKVDGCYVSDPTVRKCDYLFVACNSGNSYFVELKGRHLLEGVKQIAATLDLFAPQIKGHPGIVSARIVVAQVNRPRAIENDATVLKLRKRLKKLGGDLVYRSGSFVEIL